MRSKDCAAGARGNRAFTVRDVIILMWAGEGRTHGWIGEQLGISGARVGQVLRRTKHCARRAFNCKRW